LTVKKFFDIIKINMSKRSNDRMAKIAFTKLNLVKDTSIQILEWNG
jgi:hypothetical protein